MIHTFVKRYKYSTLIKKTSPGRTVYDAESLFKRPSKLSPPGNSLFLNG